MHVVIDTLGDNVPVEAQLLAYRAAGWGAFGFGIVGTLLAAVFLRGTGVVGYSEPIQADKDQEQDSISA